jgi:hypothetical protein
VEDQLGLSDAAPSCSQPENTQAGQQQLPDLCREYYVPLSVGSILVGRKSSITWSLLPQKSGVFA